MIFRLEDYVIADKFGNTLEHRDNLEHKDFTLKPQIFMQECDTLSPSLTIIFREDKGVRI